MEENQDSKKVYRKICNACREVYDMSFFSNKAFLVVYPICSNCRGKRERDRTKVKSSLSNFSY